MDQQQQQTQCPTPPATTIAGTAITSQPTAAQSQPLPQQQQTQTPSPLSTTTPTTASSTPATNTLNPNPSVNSSPSPKPSLTPPSRPTSLTPRPTSFSRPWQPPQQHFSNFSSSASSSSSSSSASSSTSVSPSIPPPPRGGIAIGVPAPRPSLSSPQPSPPFSSSFGQSFGSLGRSGVNAPDSVRSPGMHGLGVMGSLGSSSQMRPSGISVQTHQPRTVQQSSFRPPPSSSSSQSPATQNFQGPGHMRAPQVGSPLPNSSHSVQSFNQPWLSSASQAKPPLPSQSAFRPQMNSPSMQQRSHIPQQHSPLSTSSQQQHLSSVQPQQSKPSQQLPEHHGQQFSSTRVAQSSSQQHQITRSPGSAIQKSSSLSLVQPNAAQPYQSKIASAESDGFGNRILTKRSIHELVNQIDPSERLDPDVEEILVDIAEDFVESITTFGCSLAKHRKSDTLEAKDILVHLERNWNITLPGFSADEIKVYRKPLTNDIHKERLAAIKKSVAATEVSSARTNGGQTAVSAKGNLAKMPSNSIGSS